MSFDKNETCEEELERDFVSEGERAQLTGLFIRDILRENSGRKRHYTQARLREMLDEFPYSISVDRRTVSRAVKCVTDNFPDEFHLAPDGSAWYEPAA